MAPEDSAKSELCITRLITIVLSVLLAGKPEKEIGLSVNQFFALSVSNAGSVSASYQNVFQLKLLKEVRPADGSVHVRIIGNENLILEILQHKGSKSLEDRAIDRPQAYRMKGIFKIVFT